MTLAEQAAHLAPDLRLAHAQHHHEADHVVEHHRQQAVLVELEPLALAVAQRRVPLHHLGGALVHADDVTLLRHRVEEGVLPELHVVPQP